MKRRQVVKEVQQQRIEKALIMSKNVQLTLDFGIKSSVWIPKGDKSKMLPKVSLVLSAATNDIRLVAENVEELQQALIEVISFLDENKEDIERTKIKEQQIFIKKMQERADSELYNLQKLIGEKTESKAIDFITKKAV